MNAPDSDMDIVSARKWGFPRDLLIGCVYCCFQRADSDCLVSVGRVV
jgi:hypothetical protein